MAEQTTKSTVVLKYRDEKCLTVATLYKFKPTIKNDYTLALISSLVPSLLKIQTDHWLVECAHEIHDQSSWSLVQTEVMHLSASQGLKEHWSLKSSM